MRRHRILIAALATAALAVTPAGAEEPTRLEFFISGAWTPSAAGTAYIHSYDPHPGYAIPGSYVRQTLQINPLSGRGLKAGLNAFFGATFGMRLSAGRDETPFGGVNTPVEMSYKYTYFMPTASGSPYIDAVRNVLTDWPGTSGALWRTILGLEAVFRIPLGAALSLNLSGGPQLSFFSGDIHALAYDELTYERYGATFFATYYVRLHLPAQTVVGFTGGAELTLRLGRHVAAVLNGSYRSGTYKGTPEITAAYDFDSLLEATAEPMGRIKARMDPGPIELTPSPFVFGAGLAVVF